MRVVNNLTKPGDIRRVDLTPEAVRIEMADGTIKIYRCDGTLNGDRYTQEVVR